VLPSLSSWYWRRVILTSSCTMLILRATDIRYCFQKIIVCLKKLYEIIWTFLRLWRKVLCCSVYENVCFDMWVPAFRRDLPATIFNAEALKTKYVLP
jgi:hypothetical protein